MKNSRGFSILELMLAITLGIILCTAAIMVFVSSRTSFGTTTGVGVVSDDGRFALDFLRNSIRGAGYIGCSTSALTYPSTLVSGTTMPFNFSQSLMGYESTGTGSSGSFTVTSPPTADTTAGDWSPALDATITGATPPSGTAGVVKGTDVIVVRTGSGTAPVNVTAITNGANSFTVASTTGYAVGQLAVITNCQYTTPFQITALGTGTVTHAVGAAAGGNVASAFTYSYSAGAMMMPIDTQVYYIGIGSDGDGALMRLDLNSTTTFTVQELVPDVENMQILYGYDTTGNQTASEYYNATSIFPAVLNPNLVMSVKIALLVASPINTVVPPAAAPVYKLLGTSVTAPIDTRQRQVFEATIALRNALP